MADSKVYLIAQKMYNAAYDEKQVDQEVESIDSMDRDFAFVVANSPSEAMSYLRKQTKIGDIRFSYCGITCIDTPYLLCKEIKEDLITDIQAAKNMRLLMYGEDKPLFDIVTTRMIEGNKPPFIINYMAKCWEQPEGADAWPD